MAKKLKLDPEALTKVLADYVAARSVLHWLVRMTDHHETDDGIEALARKYATQNAAERAALEAVLALTDDDC